MSSILKTGKHTDPKVAARKRRQIRVRKKISGTPQRPRLVVTRSLRHVVAQIVDDTTSRTLASATSMEADVRALEGDKTAQAREVGRRLGQRATEAGITAAVFDRGGRAYHGRIAALADGARESGLQF